MPRHGYGASSGWRSWRRVESTRWVKEGRTRFKILVLECGHVIDTGDKRGDVGDVKRCLRCEGMGK